MMAIYNDGTEARTGDYIIGLDITGQWVMGRVIRLRINVQDANLEIAHVGSRTKIYTTDFPSESIFVRADIAIGNSSQCQLMEMVNDIHIMKRPTRKIIDEEDAEESGKLRPGY